jgi:ferritin
MKQRLCRLFFSFITAFCTLNAAPSSVLAQPIPTEHTFVASRLPETLVDAFNQQIKSELDGAHFYLNLSNHFYFKNLDGFGYWFLQQYYEELNHARIVMDYLKKKNAKVVLYAVEPPEALNSEDPAAIFEQSLRLEEIQTSRIHELQSKATASASLDAATFLQWFIDEQVQEEDHFQNVIDRILMVKGSLEGILLIEKDLALRAAAVIWSPGQPLPPH